MSYYRHFSDLEDYAVIIIAEIGPPPGAKNADLKFLGLQGFCFKIPLGYLENYCLARFSRFYKVFVD